MYQIPAKLKSNNHILRLKLLAIMLMLISTCTFSFTYTDIVHANAGNVQTQQINNCNGASQLNENSLLVVLLDRSGSLIAGDTTDPEGYSGSATDALADLWPGNIAVIPFGNNKANILGNSVFAHSNTAGLSTLKNLVNATFPPSATANTPLSLAMDQAQTLFKNGASIPSCSKIVLITDGQPDGPADSTDHDIKQAQWFGEHNIPMNVFALKLDANTNARQLLQNITTTTKGIYTPVLNATDLASSVIGLYSTWKGLSFNHITVNQQNGNYAIPIDQYVNQATILTFHDTNVSDVILKRSDGTTIAPNTLLTTTDHRHYQIDNLVSPIVSGTYTITVKNDPNGSTSVYDLLDSPLKAEFTNLASTADTGQTFNIKAHFIDEHHTGIVTKGATKVMATVTETIDGKPVTVTITLNQLSPDSDIFMGNYLIPSANMKRIAKPQLIGTLTIVLAATYNDITRSATTTVPLYVPQAPPPPPCSKGFVQCQIIPHQSQILEIGIPVLLFLLLLFLLIMRLLQPEPYGYLISKKNAKQVQLKKRSIWKRILSRTTISSSEIASHPDAIGAFSFGVTEFNITSKCKCEQKKHKQIDHIISLAKGSNSAIIIKSQTSNNTETLKSNQTYPLNQNDVITIGSIDQATYSRIPRNALSNSRRAIR